MRRLGVGWTVLNALLFAGGLLFWAIYIRRDLRVGFPDGLPAEGFGMEIPTDGVANTLMWPLAAMNVIVAGILMYQRRHGGARMPVVVPTTLSVVFAAIALSRPVIIQLVMPIVWRIMP